MNSKKATLLEAIEQLKQQSKNPFTVVIKHGTMSVEYFAPAGTDTQTPHQQDELYVITRGHGHFNRDGEIFECKAGDVLFVPAGLAHRFEHFSDDFATWVIFYGPQGGEHGNG
jgi:mannose-6-phosphate isomerase-like protein (cupin superfamily)